MKKIILLLFIFAFCFAGTVRRYTDSPTYILDSEPTKAYLIYRDGQIYNVPSDSLPGGADSDTLWEGATDSTIVLVDSTKWVGIGTDAPKAKLHIDGGVGSLNSGICFGDGNTGIYEVLDNVIYFEINGSPVVRVDGSKISSTLSNRWLISGGSPSNTKPIFCPNQTDDDTGIGRANDDQLSIISGGVEGIRITEGLGTISVAITDSMQIAGVVGIDSTDQSQIVIRSGDGNPELSLFSYDNIGGFTGGELSYNATYDGTNWVRQSTTYPSFCNFFNADSMRYEIWIEPPAAATNITWSSAKTSIDTSGNFTILDGELFHSPAHAIGTFQDSTVTIDLTQNTWATVTNATNNLFTWTELEKFTNSNDSIAPDADHHCNVSAILSGTAGTGDDFEFRITVNGAIAPIVPKIKISSPVNGSFSEVAILGYLELDADDYISLEVRNLDNNDDITFNNGVVMTTWVHQ